MYVSCKRCMSYAINPHTHGRGENDLDLCDVCYWRNRAENYTEAIEFIVDECDTESDNRIRQTLLNVLKSNK